MKERMGEKSVQIGKRNKAKIIAELIKNPMTFTELKETLDFSAKTLMFHLRDLENEGLIRRILEGKSILYDVIKPKSVIEFRKQFLSELLNLKAYDVALNEKTKTLYYQFLKTLKESIEKPEPEAETTKIMAKTIEIPKGFKGTIKQKITNMYEKPELKETETEQLKPYSMKRKTKGK